MPTLPTPDAKTLEVYLALEETYGTPPGGNWLRTFVYTFGLKPARPIERDPLLGVSLSTARDATEPAPGLTSHTGNVDVPLDIRHLGYWLTALFGPATKTGSGPYVHTFTSGAAELPTLTIGSKLNGGNPTHDVGVTVRSARFALGQEAGYRKVTLDLAGKDRLYPGSLGAGVPVAPLARAPVPATKGLLKIDGATAAKVLGFDGTYATGMEEERFVDGDDTVSGYAPGQNDTAFTGTMRLRWMNTTLEQQAKAGTPSSLEVIYELSSGLKLSLLAANAKLERNGPEIGAPGRIEQSVGFSAYQTADDPMLVVTLTNDQAGAYFA